MPDTTLPLQHARTLHHSAEGGQDLIAIHSPDGVVELRIRLTPEGAVLQMESVRLQLKAAESMMSSRGPSACARPIQLISIPTQPCT